MRIIKKVGIVLIVLVLIYVGLAIIGPKNYTVERSKNINVPANVVFDLVSKFSNWEQWSPWKEKDPTATYTLDGEDGVVGTKYSWVGDEETTGKGSMTITEIIPNQKFAYDLEFTEPWEMKSKGAFELTESENETTVKWIDSGDIPFAQRPFMLFMSIDDMIGKDFERGLFKIDSIAQIKAKEVEKNNKITETEFKGGKYIGVKHQIKISDLDSSIYANSYAKLGAYFAQNNIAPAGVPCSITARWDEEADSCDIIVAFPVEEPVENLDKDLTYVEIPITASLLFDFYGEYKNMNKAYDTIHEYMLKNNLKVGNYVIEEYITDPATVDNKEEILTKIYYLLRNAD